MSKENENESFYNEAVLNYNIRYGYNDNSSNSSNKENKSINNFDKLIDYYKESENQKDSSPTSSVCSYILNRLSIEDTEKKEEDKEEEMEIKEELFKISGVKNMD